MRRTKPIEITPDLPVWLQPEAVAGSAVRHMASLSPAFDRVEWRARGSRKVFSIGKKPEQPACKWDLDVFGPDQQRVGVVRIFSRWAREFTPAEQAAVSRVARELGDQWDPR